MLVLALVIAFVSLAGLAFAMSQLQTLKKRFNAALGTGEPASLEDQLSSYRQDVAKVDLDLKKLSTHYEQLSISNALASQKISIVRFNPFGDTGGDQSFSLAVLDAHNSGYVLTSIHGRTGTRVYVKPVDLGKSKYTLSDEEQQALAQAEKRVPKSN
jgi:hypothetical protein